MAEAAPPAEPLRLHFVQCKFCGMLIEGAGVGHLSGGIHTGMQPEGECEMYSLSTPRNIHVMDPRSFVAFASKKHFVIFITFVLAW